MVRKRKCLVLVLFILGVILFSTALLSATTDAAEVTGMVYASEWDANDKVVAVEIVTGEGDAFAVFSAGKGSELLTLEDKVVTATGTITTDENERKTITISSYTVQE